MVLNQYLRPQELLFFPHPAGQLVDILNGYNMNQRKHVNELNSTYFSCPPVQSPQKLKRTPFPQAFHLNTCKNTQAAKGITFYYGFRHLFDLVFFNYAHFSDSENFPADTIKQNTRIIWPLLAHLLWWASSHKYVFLLKCWDLNDRFCVGNSVLLKRI